MLRPDDEAVFHNGELAGVTGVLLRITGTNEVVYVPNVYTTTVDAKHIYEKLGWGMESRTLGRSDL